MIGRIMGKIKNYTQTHNYIDITRIYANYNYYNCLQNYLSRMVIRKNFCFWWFRGRVMLIARVNFLRKLVKAIPWQHKLWCLKTCIECVICKILPDGEEKFSKGKGKLSVERGRLFRRTSLYNELWIHVITYNPNKQYENYSEVVI